jgi:dynein heavy chain
MTWMTHRVLVVLPVLSLLRVYSKAKRMLENNPVVALLREKISEFQNTLPVVSDLRNPDLQKHHWDAIQKLLAHDVKNDPNFTLGTLITLNAMQHKQEISIISNKAAQEMQLQEMLNKVIQTWNELNLPIAQHKDQKVSIAQMTFGYALIAPT